MRVITANDSYETLQILTNKSKITTFYILCNDVYSLWCVKDRTQEFFCIYNYRLAFELLKKIQSMNRRL